MPRKKKTEPVRFKEVNCIALNVRSNPSKESIIVKMIPRGTIVECDPNFNNEEWDHIITGLNIEGYCMKEFLSPLAPDNTAALKEASERIIHVYGPKCDSVINEEAKDGSKES